ERWIVRNGRDVVIHAVVTVRRARQDVEVLSGTLDRGGADTGPTVGLLAEVAVLHLDPRTPRDAPVHEDWARNVLGVPTRQLEAVGRRRRGDDGVTHRSVGRTARRGAGDADGAPANLEVGDRSVRSGGAERVVLVELLDRRRNPGVGGVNLLLVVAHHGREPEAGSRLGQEAADDQPEDRDEHEDDREGPSVLFFGASSEHPLVLESGSAVHVSREIVAEVYDGDDVAVKVAVLLAPLSAVPVNVPGVCDWPTGMIIDPLVVGPLPCPVRFTVTVTAVVATAVLPCRSRSPTAEVKVDDFATVGVVPVQLVAATMHSAAGDPGLTTRGSVPTTAPWLTASVVASALWRVMVAVPTPAVK